MKQRQKGPRRSTSTSWFHPSLPSDAALTPSVLHKLKATSTLQFQSVHSAILKATFTKGIFANRSLPLKNHLKTEIRHHK